MRVTREDFEDLLSRDKYLFHLHTNYSDGLNSIEDYFRYASKKKYRTIIFTEHVRKNITYNFDDFYSEIKRFENNYEMIKAVVGVEAKILPDGSIDISDNILSKIDLLCIACHSFPDNINLYEEAFKKVFMDPKWKTLLRVWVHPGRFLQRSGLLRSNTNVFKMLISTAIKEGIFIENNLKQDFSLYNLIESIPSGSMIVGHDAHSVNELDY